MPEAGAQSARPFCRVCGDAGTVKSHILPRALFHDMKRGDPIIGERRDGRGFRTLQSGDWDDRILCGLHEAALGEADRYGIDFCRLHTAAVVAAPDALFREVALPRPDLLVSFAAACVWRKGVVGNGQTRRNLLGPYDDRLKQLLFHEDRSWEPELIVTSHQIHNGTGAPMNMAILPTPWRIGRLHFWRFVVQGLVFNLKLDNRTIPASEDMWPVNGRDVATVWAEPPMAVQDIPGLMGSLERMASPCSGTGPAVTRRRS